MDQHISLARLCPTAVPKRPDSPLETGLPDHRHLLAERLRDQTKALRQSPYDPSMWISRASILEELGFPELAAGDHWKADRLCHHVRSFLDSRAGSTWRLGNGRGFWMLDADESEGSDLDGQNLYETPEPSFDQAWKETRSRSSCFWNDAKGAYVPQAYPWLSEQHAGRSDELVVKLSKELAQNPVQKEAQSCEVRRCTFGLGDGPTTAATGLGVFAMYDIPAGTKLLIDKSEIFGCIGPGSDGSSKNLHGGRGCLEVLHPNLEDDDAKSDLRWIRDRLGKHAAEPIMLCRALLACVRQGVRHPLDQSDIARLTPTYHLQDHKYFWLENDIAIPNEALQQFGIDIFANTNFDTWVIFTISARLDNNTWSDPSTSCLNSLFSLFNHSCSPNVKWTTQDDHLTVSMRTAKGVLQGDQLFVEYDSFMHDCTLDERQERLSRWIDGPCLCERCVQESKEVDAKEVGAKRKAMGQAKHDLSGSHAIASLDGTSDDRGVQERPSWDDHERPVLPEDFQSYWR